MSSCNIKLFPCTKILFQIIQNSSRYLKKAWQEKVSDAIRFSFVSFDQQDKYLKGTMLKEVLFGIIRIRPQLSQANQATNTRMLYVFAFGTKYTHRVRSHTSCNYRTSRNNCSYTVKAVVIPCYFTV